YNGHQGAVYAIDCGTRENQVIVVSGSADKSVIVWDFRSGSRLHTFSESAEEVYAVDLSEDGGFVAAGGRDGIARVWDLSSGQLVGTFTE
ncbi:MAG: serine/threonine protein kinase, partial [Candidatus Poribacteria bacterium]|nr:serine/threonine protein kinase [Candidatus Poribacteria bacterium]